MTERDLFEAAIGWAAILVILLVALCLPDLLRGVH